MSCEDARSRGASNCPHARVGHTVDDPPDLQRAAAGTLLVSLEQYRRVDIGEDRSVGLLKMLLALGEN